MKAKAAKFSLAGGIIMLIFSVYMALMSGLLHDMAPIDPYVQFIENLESIIFGCGGFIVAGLAIAGGLLSRHIKKTSRVFIILSAALCFIFAIVSGLIIESIIVSFIILIPAVLLVISCVLSFIHAKDPGGNNGYVGN